MQAEKIAVLHGTSHFELVSGTIESVDTHGYRILCDTGLYRAGRAFSCFVEPMQGDIVLFSIDAQRQCHILSILERPGNDAASLVFPGDVTLSANQGQLNLNARQGVAISADENISMASEEYTLLAKKGMVSVDQLNAIGTSLVSKIRNVRTIADTLETIAGHLVQKLRNSFRQVECVDQSQSRDRISTVKNLYSMRSKQAAILAEKDIKMDAERIHMG